MLITLHEVMKEAVKGGYAVPAFNTWSLEDTKAIIRGAEEANSPVVIMTSPSAIKNMGVKIAAEIVKELARQVSIPVVLHLDHATDVNVIYQAMQAGYTSVMYDGSMLPIEENIDQTLTIREAGRALNISVEAEIGRLARGEEGEESKEVLTTPAAAREFAERTEVDALAVAVGTCHGMQSQSANLRRELAKQIGEVVDIPLVLHGSSGVKNEDIEYISQLSFGKINFGTKLKNSYTEAIREIVVNDKKVNDHLKVLLPASKRITEIVKEKIALTGSSGKG